VACWVVNEWLLHDLRGDNGQERQMEADRFLDTVIHRCDVIVFVMGSPFQALITSNADGIITTDEDLQKALTLFGISVVMRDDFLKQKFT